MYWIQMKLGHIPADRGKVQTTFKLALDTLKNNCVDPKLENTKTQQELKLVHNMYVASRDQLPGETLLVGKLPDRDKTMLSNAGYLDKLNRLLTDEPWNLKLAKTGVVASSLLEDMVYGRLFYNALIALDRRFKDSSYSPYSATPSFKEDPDMAYFIANKDTQEVTS